VIDAEVRNRTNVNLLAALRHVADRHVFDHALTQWRRLLTHEKLLSGGLYERAILTHRTIATDSAGSAPDTGWGAKVGDVSQMAWLSHSLLMA
jgi:hypothetical protein